MRLPALRTLSARILLGFAVLILTFGGVSLSTVINMDRLGRQIRVVRTGFLPLAFTTKELLERQTTLQNYLNELHEKPDGESESPIRAAKRLRIYLTKRDNALRQAEDLVAALEGVLGKRGIADQERFLGPLRREVDQQRELYEALAPAGDAAGAAPAVEQRREELADRALGRLIDSERAIANMVRGFDMAVQQRVEMTSIRLESNSAKLRLYTIYLGATAVIAGLLITVWATLTLRPLTRLREGARRIARGDYAGRIESRGPTEVADLANEFNSMAQAIEERERDLVRSERLAAVGKMAAMITHEIRNPLSSIGLNTELLEEELAALPAPQAAEARGLCTSITTEVDRLTAITEEYLRFARLPKPKLQAEPIEPIVQGVVDFERETLAQRGVALSAELAPGMPPVAVDEGQLRQALLNLIRNAADAVEEVGGGAVTVATASARLHGRAAVEVAVADDGPGIAADLRPKVFDPFFSTKEGGTGLGLALTLQIVVEHGGTIRVDENPGGGARFVVALPCLTGEAADSKLPPS